MGPGNASQSAHALMLWCAKLCLLEMHLDVLIGEIDVLIGFCCRCAYVGVLAGMPDCDCCKCLLVCKLCLEVIGHGWGCGRQHSRGRCYCRSDATAAVLLPQ